MEMKLTEAEVGKEYMVESVNADDPEMNDFLFTLGCYKGEVFKFVSVLSGAYVILVKNVKYSIDRELAGVLLVSAVN